MTTESLLSEFPPVTTEQWEHCIRETVKGAEYASKMIWHPEEGLAVKPYYRSEDLADLSFLDAAPGIFPYVRGARLNGDWRIREELEVLDLEEANRAACSAIAAGAEEIAFHSSALESPSDLALLLANLDEIPVHFASVDRAGVALLIERLRTTPRETAISTDTDPLVDLDYSAEIVRAAPLSFRPFVIHPDKFHEQAAGAVEEVSFALSAAVDFIAEMQERGLELDRIANSLSFSFATGPEFFVQIAKLRAFRMVWAKAVETFGGSHSDGASLLHAHTANWNRTVYDPHANILRATTEVISAILGGADTISCAPFDECYRHPDENSRRLARNTQIILKQEALLSRVADPLGGSYMVEALTNSIAARAWKLFQELEIAGGYQKAQAAGVIASVLDRRTNSREQTVDFRRRVLTGTNRFANASEKALDRIDETRDDSAPRAAQSFESLRFRTERFIQRTGHQPRILLAEIGDVKMRSARSQFAADFLACAGLATKIQQFKQVHQIADSNAALIVLCSSDAEYLPTALELLPCLRSRGSLAKVVIAGNPDSAEQLRDLGVSEFIHIRSNAAGVLAGIQRLIEIRD
jgi:methylmalonyl-CoA mutase